MGFHFKKYKTLTEDNNDQNSKIKLLFFAKHILIIQTIKNNV